MQPQTIGALLITGGLLTLALGVGGLAEPRTAQAQTGPSTRPTLVPTKTPRHQSGPETLYGHITGTVIDTQSSQPIAGVSVQVGDATVLTDANGNYDHWLPVGAYTIALILDPALGTPTEAQSIVEVTAGERTLHHLSFTGRASTQPQAVSALAVPTVPAIDPAAVPVRLPVTASGDIWGWAWLPAGVSLLLAGGLLLRPARNTRRRAVDAISAANSGLLGTLLAPTASKDDLLRTLLGQTETHETHHDA